MRNAATRGAVRTLQAAAAILLLVTGACDEPRHSSSRRVARDEADAAPYQAAIDEGLGAAVAILVDTSGSMKEKASGDTRPKYVVAREAIEAMREARPDLYRAGVFRKYLLVVTDGDNTSGRNPEGVAREIFSKSQGAVQVYFVAFDTTPQKFAFLKEVGGDVIGAGTGDELHKALDGIYQGKILAEAPDAGEREPVRK
jgi:hypothetical protein